MTIKDLERLYGRELTVSIIQRNKKILKIMDTAYFDIGKKVSKSTVAGIKFNKPLQRHISNTLLQLQKSTETILKNGIVNSWELANTKNSQLVNQYLQGKPVPSTNILKSMRQLNYNAMNSFISRTENGFTLSDKVWRLNNQTKNQINTAISSGVLTGKSAKSITQDLKSYLNNPDKLFKRVRQEGKLIPSKAMKSFHPGRGVYRSSYKNALRLSATETNIAYHTSDFIRRQQLPFITGVTVHLSNNHPVYDICDSMKGDYPKGFKFTGWHPWCRCYSTSKMLTDDEFIEYLNTNSIDNKQYVTKIPKNAISYINRNKLVFERLQNKPYFLKDNFTDTLRLKSSVVRVSKLIPKVTPVVESVKPTAVEFVPAKTIKEAEEWAKNNYKGLHEYKESDVKYKNRSPEDYGVFNYKRLSVDQANSINKVLYESNLHADKIGLPRLRGIKAKITSPGASADYSDGVMGINKATFNPIGISEKNVKYEQYLNGWKREEKLRIKKGRKPTTTPSYFIDDPLKVAESRYWHEYGHHIDMQKGLLGKISEYLNDLTKKVYRTKELPRDSIVFVSNYFPAVGGTREWFAESYSLYKMGLKDKLPHGFIEFLKTNGID